MTDKRTNQMDQILEGMVHSNSPIELRMQVDDQAHDEMLREITQAALERLEGDRSNTVLKFIHKCGGRDLRMGVY